MREIYGKYSMYLEWSQFPRRQAVQGRGQTEVVLTISRYAMHTVWIPSARVLRFDEGNVYSRCGWGGNGELGRALENAECAPVLLEGRCGHNSSQIFQFFTVFLTV